MKIKDQLNKNPKLRRKIKNIKIYTEATFLSIFIYIFAFVIVIYLIVLLSVIPKLQTNIQAAICGGIFTVGTAMISLIIGGRSQAKKAILLKQYDDKKGIYKQLINELFVLTSNYNNDSDTIRLCDFKKFIYDNNSDLYTYASAKIIKKIDLLLNEMNLTVDEISISQSVLSIIKCVKSELGYPDDELKANETFNCAITIPKTSSSDSTTL
jgi:hypothetical protein